MDNGKKHDLALLYADTKLKEFQLNNREVIGRGNLEMSLDEIEYLASAYDFAIKNLSD